jgi:hypothetical protein
MACIAADMLSSCANISPDHGRAAGTASCSYL